LIVLTSGLALFICLHALREFGWRDSLLQAFGRERYRIFISVGILLSFVLIVIGKSYAAFVQIWVPPYSIRAVTHLLMISSCIMFSAGFLPPSHTRALVSHPMLTGVVIWGVAHLISNGDLASLLLFGALAGWALVKIISLTNASRESPARPAGPPSLQWDAAAIMLGMIAYGALLVFHGPLFGFALTGPM